MYTNARYNKSEAANPSSITVEISGVIAVVPLDPANTDYQNIMKLVEDGELTIAPAEEPAN